MYLSSQFKVKKQFMPEFPALWSTTYNYRFR